MQPVGIAPALRRVGRGNQAAGAVGRGEILDDRARLGERESAVGDYRRLAERMHRPQLGRREHRLRIALVGLDLVLQAELFEQPEHALRARVVQVVDEDHGFLLFSFLMTSFSPDQVSSTAHTLTSTSPRGSATSRIVSSVMSVGTLEDFFGQDTQIAASGLIRCRAFRNAAASLALLVTKKCMRSASPPRRGSILTPVGKGATSTA